MKDPKWRARVIRESKEHRVREVYKANGDALHTLIVQWVNDRPELEKYVGLSIGWKFSDHSFAKNARALPLIFSGVKRGRGRFRLSDFLRRLTLFAFKGRK
jgi:hypothetical protein